MRRLFVLSFLIFHTWNLIAQDNKFRTELSLGRAKFVGGDIKDMHHNGSAAIGLILESNGNSDYARKLYGVRYRFLRASRDYYYNDSIGQLAKGIEKYQYNYIEFPVYGEFDILSGSSHVLSIGLSGGVFGAIPFGVRGERTYPNAVPWSKKYETPYFILGFQVGGYFGINLERVSILAHVNSQFPFIPIHNSPAAGSTNYEYKPQLLSMGGAMLSVSFKFD
jgi:hypothetical protein